CRLAPGQGQYLTTLGVAQYRAREYEKAARTLAEAEQQHAATAAGLALSSTPPLLALTALAQADRLRQASAANLAFLAMTQHHLGQEKPAQANLARLREAMQKPEWSRDEEAVRFLHEAEDVLKAR